MTTTENNNEPEFKYRIQEVRYNLLHGIKKRYIHFDDRETDYKARRELWNKKQFENLCKQVYPDRVDPTSLFRDAGPYHKRECPVCGFVFYPDSGQKIYCSQRCMNDAYMQRRKQRLEQNRLKYCRVCNKLFQAKRNDTVYCSAACKQRAYRARIHYEELPQTEKDRIFSEELKAASGGGDL